MKVLVANVGSTSFKYRLFEMGDECCLANGKVERIDDPPSPLSHQVLNGPIYRETLAVSSQSQAIARLLELLASADASCIGSLAEVAAVGFKAVHAGDCFGPSLVDESLIARMAQFNDVAPAHNPPYIQAMRTLRDLLPWAQQVAVFETGFHRDIPDYAYTYSIPYEWREKYQIRRYGFHGNSFRYIAARVPELLNCDSPGLRIIACHLGGSSSVCAIRDGRSIDTSMGFSPQGGVPMGARCGDIDPFMIFRLVEQQGLPLKAVREQLSSQSGLLGMSGIGADARELLQAAAAGNDRARLALQVYGYSVKKYVGAYAAALGGVDALVFSGGIGENCPELRAEICEGLEFLSIRLDADKNQATVGRDANVAAGPIPVLVIRANEELMVARSVRTLLDGKNSTPAEARK